MDIGIIVLGFVLGIVAGGICGFFAVYKWATAVMSAQAANVANKAVSIAVSRFKL